MMLVLATVRYESVTLAPRERQLVAVPGKISYGEAKARLLGSCITTTTGFVDLMASGKNNHTGGWLIVAARLTRTMMQRWLNCWQKDGSIDGTKIA